MKQDSLKLQMMDYFMAMATHFDWNMDFRTFVIESGKILNFLQGSGVIITTPQIKYEAAGMLLDHFCGASKMELPADKKAEMCRVLMNDTKTLPDAVTFAIDELYEMGHELTLKRLG